MILGLFHTSDRKYHCGGEEIDMGVRVPDLPPVFFKQTLGLGNLKDC